MCCSFFNKVAGLTYFKYLWATASDCNGSFQSNIHEKAVLGDYSH